MIIRKFVTALRQQDWATVTIEFLIVVAGIFVGLQVDDWSQRRLAAESEEAVLALIAADMQREIKFIDQFSARFEEARRGTEDLIQQLRSFPEVELNDISESITRAGSGWV